MIMDRGVRELSSGMVNGLRYGDFCSSRQNINMNGFRLGQPSQHLWNHHNPRILCGTNPLNPEGNPSSAHHTSPGGDSSEDCEIFSDIALNYISRMLMEEDIDEKVSNYQEESALRAAEKSFYDVLGQKYPPSPDQPPLYSHHSLESPDESSYSNYGNSSTSGNGWTHDFSEYQQQSQAFPAASLDHTYRSSSSSSSTSSNGVGNVAEAVEEPLFGAGILPDVLLMGGSSLPASQFRRGVEEARKFLPSKEKLIIDLEGSGVSPLPREPRSAARFVGVKAEEEETEYPVYGSRGRKNLHREDLDLEEGRSNKQSAIYSEETIRSEMFDLVLLCQGDKCSKKMSDLREAMQNEANKNAQNNNGHAKGSSGGKARGKKQNKREVVDLRTLLVHCAQAVSADDRRTAGELLRQIRQHSSPNGDGTQRLANCFADGLQARLAGTGSQIYHTLVAKRTTATDILKAYHLYIAACPFKKISHFFSNQTILNVAEKASRVHIIDFGIYFGFQWPCLIQRLAGRAGGPPKLRITGIDVPQPGFRPTEQIEETGRRLADYARSFNVPFEYQGIASKWETIRVEDLKIDKVKDEVVVVNCLYRFRNLVDETVIVDSPRNKVLNTIRKINPDVFIHGVVNGSYSAPFFVTRFREALFHYSALFDMLETNVPREDEQRLLIERDLFGREALNVIACEGSERVERPETYKQWQVRNLRAGFRQLPLNPGIMKKAKDKVRTSYHKDFVIDEDSRWLLQGWKGRVIYAVSTWKPNQN